MTTRDETADATSPGLDPGTSIVAVQEVPTRLTPRRGPAMIVLGVVAAISLGGFALAALSSPSKSTPADLGLLRGTSIAASSANAAVAEISVSGNPPQDVRASLVLPNHATIIGVTKHPQSLELYSGAVTVAAPYDVATLVTFYRLELVHRGWSVTRTDATATGHGTEIFATFPSKDGFYWEVELLVEPSAASSFSAALGGASMEASSHVELQLLELNDQD